MQEKMRETIINKSTAHGQSVLHLISIDSNTDALQEKAAEYEIYEHINKSVCFALHFQ